MDIVEEAADVSDIRKELYKKGSAGDKITGITFRSQKD